MRPSLALTPCLKVRVEWATEASFDVDGCPEVLFSTAAVAAECSLPEEEREGLVVRWLELPYCVSAAEAGALFSWFATASSSGMEACNARLGVCMGISGQLCHHAQSLAASASWL